MHEEVGADRWSKLATFVAVSCVELCWWHGVDFSYINKRVVVHIEIDEVDVLKLPKAEP